MLEADIFRSPRVECPHCGEIFDIDESDIEEETECCYCSKRFISKES